MAAPNLLIVAQSGRLEFQAILFAASLRHSSPGFAGRLVVAVPRPEGAWAGHDTRIGDETRSLLAGMGAEIVSFAAMHFGASYPHGNKIEALSVLPPGQPFAFFDTDTLVTGPLDGIPFGGPPAASMRREGTWPRPPLYGPGRGAIWRSLYDRFGLDFASSQDTSHRDEHWERYLYFNAGWFLGPDPAPFGQRFTDWALSVRDSPPDELASQRLDPWLDQIVLPLVVHSLGGGRPGAELSDLDGRSTCHYRNLPLLYAREPGPVLNVLESVAARNRIKKRLKAWEPARRLIYQGKGRDAVRPLFAGGLPPLEKPIRQALKKSGWWSD